MNITEIRSKLRDETQKRSFSFDFSPQSEYKTRGVFDKEKRLVEFSLSSEEPYLRWYGWEILGHKDNEVDMARMLNKAPLCFEHETSNVIGVIESATIKDNRIICVARFSRNKFADEVFQDFIDGIRTKISVGYTIQDLEEFGEPDSNGYKSFRVTKWQPFEASSVGVPADDLVGVGRSLQVNKQEVKEQLPETVSKAIEEKNDVATETTGTKTEKLIITGVRTMTQEVNEPANSPVNHAEEIKAIAKRFNKLEMGMEFISKGKTADEFSKAVLNEFNKDASAFVGQKSNAEIGMTQKEKEQYSITNAVCDLMEGKTENSFEREVSRELDKKLGASRHKNSIRVPLDMQMYNPQVRAMSQGTNSAGGYLVQTDLLSESMIDVLRNKMVVSQLGATVLTGLVDSIAIPRVTAATSGSWIAENSAASEGSVTLDQVTMSPKTASVHTVLSRKLRQMVRNPSIDAFVFNEIAKTANVTIDAAAFNGTGASNQPTGIRNQSGINTVDSGTDGGAPTWAFIVDMESEVANDNADFGALAYVTNSKVRGKMKKTNKGSSVDMYLYENTSLNEYPLYVTNQLPSNITKGAGSNLSTMLFGNFNDLILGYWGSLELVLDTSYYSTDGRHRITCFIDYDVAVRHPESFCELSGIITT